MVLNIGAGIMGVIAFAAGIWAWKIEHEDANENKQEKESEVINHEEN